MPFPSRSRGISALAPPGPPALDSGHPLSRGLIGCWVFNLGGGCWIPNLATRGARGNGNSNGTVWGSGRWGKTLLVAGDQSSSPSSNPGVTVADDLGAPAAITHLCLTQIGHSDFGFLSDGRAGSGTYWWMFTNLEYDSLVVSGDLSGRLGSWAHLGVTATSTTVTGFVDGVQTGQQVTIGVNTSVGTGFRIGTQFQDAYGALGPMGGYWLYNRALTASEVLQHARAPFAMLLPPASVPYLGVAAAADAVPVCWAQYRRRRGG